MSESMHNYTISLPYDTSNDIIEWFEFMYNHSDLSAQLANLVQAKLSNPDVNEAVYAAEVDDFISSDNFSNGLLDNLYNWEAASSAAFSDEKKQKKKMLSV